jgi:peptidyl-prolyl cis-trans isomerase C
MRRFALLLPLLIAAFSTGCGSRPDVLAEVGNRTITAQDFNEIVAGNEMNYPTNPDSAKQVALHDMMRRELLVVEALRRGLDKDSLAVRYRNNIEERVLVDALYRRAAPPTVSVTPGEIDEFYAWRDSTAHAKLIFTPTRASADAALAALKAGEDFGTVADRYNLTSTMPPGGDLGFRMPGDLVDPLDEQLRVAALNQPIGPLQAPTEGWFIIEVVERNPSHQPPLDQMRGELEMMLRQRKQRTLANRAYISIRDQYKVQVADGGPQVIFQYYNRNVNGDDATPPSTDELATVLARYQDADGKPLVYTFGDALDDLRDRRRSPPNMTLLPAIERWVESQIVRRAAYLEAKRQHLEDEPDIARRIDRESTSYLVDGLFTSAINPRVHVDDDDIRAAYERRSAVLQKPFDALSQAERNALANDAAAMKSEEAFIAFTDSLATTVKPYRIVEDHLARLPWPPPAAPTP